MVNPCPFSAKMKEQYDEVYRANGKILAPSTAYMYTVLEIAARKVLETPGIDSLQCVCSPTGIPTYGSTQTVFAMFSSAAESYRLENNEMVNWPAARAYEVKMPGQVDTLLTHPWGGGTLPLYFQDDPRVRNVRQLTGFTDREMMEGVVGLQQVYEAEIKQLPEAEQVEALKAMGENMQPGMPPRENPLVHRCTDVAYGRGGNKSVTCVIRSMMAYQTTGLLQAATANYLISGHQLTSGFASACEAVGHNELYGQITNFGYETSSSATPCWPSSGHRLPHPTMQSGRSPVRSKCSRRWCGSTRRTASAACPKSRWEWRSQPAR